MSNAIVIVHVSEQLAPLPATLQQCGAFISQGGTTLADGKFLALTSKATLATILESPLAVTSLAWAGGTVTAATTATTGITIGDTFLTTITGASPATYNGTFVATSTGASEFTYDLVANPGSTPATGTILYTGRNVAELVAMNDTWWAQVNAGNVAPFVLELGASEDSTAITALGTYLDHNPNSDYKPGAIGYFYSYLTPRSWADVSSFYHDLVPLYNAPTSRTMFFVTMSNDTYTNFTNLDSCVMGLIEAPTISLASEYSLAAGFFVTLNYQPSSTNKVPPLNNAFVYGVTPYPIAGNSTLLATYRAAGVNWIGTGAEGGLSFTTFVFGITMDVKPFNFRYSVDWAQINLNVDVANAVINGSNSTVNPLYYNQDGINRLQAVAAGTLARGIQSGLIVGNLIQTELDPQTFFTNVNNGVYTGNCVINAVPFQTYLNANPSNYALQIYGGYTVVMTPQLGFNQIVFNLEATEFA